ncbi:metal ABC transporter solute-binding protein, Zn/Mn family [Reinekea blandensis]|uniref:High-affinity zinc transport system substrate-binding protein n=1 Tax=Reinekea blandensis MED297 TaxID=314283 RepID=A4BI96_9GAMM|nr:zinc ABC transporter substrate-binding protein [Reinekea blandensis]EAR08103.1 high-affinity zinc transport system substrate-binding protein [Reinekea sp. MED297] [Reinekea blandensis MED297]
MNRFGQGLFASGLMLLSAYTLSHERVEVIASFSILGDMIEQIGQEHVAVTSLVGINEDPHVYSPTPREVRKVQSADLVVLNGLGFEGWMTRLLEASEYKGISLLVAEGVMTDHGSELDVHEDEHEHEHDSVDDHSHEDHEDHEDHDEAHEQGRHEEHDGLEHEHDHGGIDPHAWHSALAGREYFHHITEALIALLPEHKAEFEQREREVLAQLSALDQKMKVGLEAVPESKRVLITVHSGFRYLEQAYGIEMLSPAGLTTAGDVSARDVADVVRFIKDNQVQAIFAENITDNRLITQVAKEAGIPVFGELYSGALSDASGPAATYLEMLTYNYDQILNALQQ